MHFEKATFIRIQPKRTFHWLNESFFFYAGLILLFGAFAVPNYTALPDWLFRLLSSLVIALINFLLYKRMSTSLRSGTLVFFENKICIYDMNQNTEQQFMLSDIKKIHVFDGMPSDLFHFSDAYKTQLIEFIFHSGQTVQLECETNGKIGQQEISLKELVHSII